MLKLRVIISLCFDEGVLKRTKKFVADYVYTQAYLAVDAVDEVFLIDITRGGPSEASREAMGAYADRCFAPVTMGGWVGSAGDAREMFALGADKVVVGGAAFHNPGLMTELAEKYGSQAVVCGVDFSDGMVQCGKTGRKTGVSPVEWAKTAEKRGAGEIFLQSIDRDGSLLGYDLQMIREVAENCQIPLVVGGGCGGWRHMAEALESGATGCVTSVIHHFTETSLAGFKRELSRAGFPVREAA